MIAGIGAGLFVLLLLIGLSVFICLFTYKLDFFPAIALGLSIICVIVLSVLISSPKQPLNAPPDTTVYDHTYVKRSGILITLVVFLAAALIVMAKENCLKKMQGNRVRSMAFRRSNIDFG